MATTNNILSGRRFVICGGGMVLFFFLGVLFLNYVSVGAFEDDVMYVGLGNEKDCIKVSESDLLILIFFG